MFILVVIVAAIIIAVARGGSLANLAHIEFRWFYLLFIPLVLELIITSPLASFIPGGLITSNAIYLSALIIGAIVVWQNRRLPGFGLLLAGLLLNTLVIVANGGHMPVWPSAREFAGLPPLVGPENNVMPLDNTSVLGFLADFLPLPRFMPLANVFSLGDILITIGGVWFLTKVIGAKQRVTPTADAALR